MPCSSPCFNTTMTTTNSGLLSLQWPTISEYTNVNTPTSFRSLSNLEQNNYPDFGQVRHCSQLPMEQDPVARAKVRAWLNGSCNPILPMAWSLAQQDFTMRDETNLREWLLRQLVALEVITPRLTGDVWPIRPGYTYRTVFGMYKTRTQAVEYDIACSVVEENHRISATVVFCPIEIKIEPTFERNQEEILGWLRAGRIDHPAVTKSGTLPASNAMFLQVSTMQL
jgi:hypothetical protein